MKTRIAMVLDLNEYHSNDPPWDMRSGQTIKKRRVVVGLSFLFRQEFLEGFIIQNTSTDVVLTNNCFVDALLYVITLFLK